VDAQAHHAAYLHDHLPRVGGVYTVGHRTVTHFT